MVRCWEFDLAGRPTFSTIYSQTTSYLERIAGYLELNFNPFEGREYSILTNPMEEEDS